MNPFDYQRPLGSARIVDRRAEWTFCSALRPTGSRCGWRRRRFGKTTPLAHVVAMRAAGHRAVRVDFSRVGTVADAATRVAEAYAVLPADPRRRVARWAGRLQVGPLRQGPHAVQPPRSEP